MKKMKKCHPMELKIGSKMMKVTIKFKENEMYAVYGMAQKLADGCVCTLVKTIFMDGFQDIAKETLATMKAKAQLNESSESSISSP